MPRRRIATTSLPRRQVFHTGTIRPCSHPKEWAPLDNAMEDSELVYPAPTPSLSLTDSFGRQSLQFESLLLGVCCIALLDSGATHSFVSSSFCSSHGIPFKRKTSTASLANGSSVPVVGIIKACHLKLGAFRCTHTFLVLDMPQYDVVLGMDFLHSHDPIVRWRKGRMHLPVPKGFTTQVVAWHLWFLALLHPALCSHRASLNTSHP